MKNASDEEHHDYEAENDDKTHDGKDESPLVVDEDASIGAENESPIQNEDATTGTDKESQQSQPVHVELQTAEGDKTTIDAGYLQEGIFIVHPPAKTTDTSEKNLETSTRLKRTTKNVNYKETGGTSKTTGKQKRRTSSKTQEKNVLLRANNTPTWKIC